MKNWKQLSEAMGYTLPDDEMNRVAAALDGLEKAFDPLRKSVPADAEPVTIYRLDRGEAE